MARIVLIWPFVLCLLNLQTWGWARHAALGLFGLMAISDGLDGYLARRLNAHTLLGKFLDPLADKLLISATVVILGVPHTAIPGKVLPNWVVVAAVGKDLLVFAGFVVIYLITHQVFIQPRPAGKACTTLQFAMLVAMLLWPDLPTGARWLPEV